MAEKLNDGTPEVGSAGICFARLARTVTRRTRRKSMAPDSEDTPMDDVVGESDEEIIGAEDDDEFDDDDEMTDEEDDSDAEEEA